MEINFDDSRLMAKLSALAEVHQDVNRVVEVGMRTGAQQVQAAAKLLAPVAPDSGELRNSIHTAVESDGDGISAYVYTDSDHAAFVEFGTGQRGMAGGGDGSDIAVSYREDWPGMSPQPYLYPAAQSTRGKVGRTIKQYLRKAIKSIARRR